MNRCDPSRRRGIALLMVLMVGSSFLIIGMLFTGAVTAEYRAAVYYRQAAQAEQFCVAGLHRAMGELMYDVWGVCEDRPFLSARYSRGIVEPQENLLPLSSAAYYHTGSGPLEPILRQRGFWNGEAWVVWAGDRVDPPPGFGNPWNMDPRPETRPEIRGGAQRYLSYGSSAGRLTCTPGNTYVHGDSRVRFDPAWPAGTEISIDGHTYHVEAVIDGRNLILREEYRGRPGRDIGWCLPGSGDCPASADRPPTFAGGAQSLRDFLRLGRGYAADPRWVDPARFICRRPSGGGEAWRWGGVDLNADGTVTAVDKYLRDWALWQLRCDAFLPEAGDNHDLFQAGLHANNRSLYPNGRSADAGWEFVDPRIVGDSFYLVFRFDPLYSLAAGVSGDPDWRPGRPLDGGAGGSSNRAGYRYPYDRTHLGRWAAVDPERDPAGGLVNINACNNDFQTEFWTGLVPAGRHPQDLVRHHYPEAKWIYCFNHFDATPRGAYAVTVQPDCGTWNASALSCGNVQIVSRGARSSSSTGEVAAAGRFLRDLRGGFGPQSGEPLGAAILSAHSCCASPVRPSPLPAYWANLPAGGGAWYYSGEAHRSAVDYSRAQEIVGEYTGKTHNTSQPYVSRGLRVPIHNYRIWLGPYASRAELATHLRKSCLVVFDPPYPGPPDNCAKSPAGRRRMEQRDLSAAARARIEFDARLISSLTSVHGYSYNLDRLWERQLLVLEKGAGAAGSRSDPRFATPQSASGRRLGLTTACRRPSQRLRSGFLRELRGLECCGGYRTPDGSYRLLDYLFDREVEQYDPTAPPHGCGVGPAYGRGGTVQRGAGRLEKFLALTASRTACMLRGGNARVAACSRGHLLNSPRVDSWHRPAWTGYSKTRNRPRRGAADRTVDDIADGCPVCGARLFLSHLHELFINEVGRFREDFRNAERPVRAAFDLDRPEHRPVRHFVELLACGQRGWKAGLEGSEDLVRFDGLEQHAKRGEWARYPGVLRDALTGMPYFTSSRGFEMRWRGRRDEQGARDPEPVFRELGHAGCPAGSQWDLRLLVFVRGPHGGRWHDVTHCVEGGRAFARDRDGEVFDLADPPLYDGSHRTVASDAAPDSADWPLVPVRADEFYTMPDPDPAHRQAGQAGGWHATVSIYRKMPVRWYGGERRSPFEMEYEAVGEDPAPLGKWREEFRADPAPAAARPAHLGEGRGLGFGPCMRLAYAVHRHDLALWRYRGDYHPVRNPGGWPGPARRDGVTRLDPEGHPGARLASPRQYGVVTFDSRFDASRLALVRCGRASSRPDYSSWRLIDYVEFTDSAGAPVTIGACCGRADPQGGGVLSWQCRNPLDNRSNADGYTAWDLLPMTLQNTDHGGALDARRGYDPWRIAGYSPGCCWWGNGYDHAAVDRVANPNPVPPGYADLFAAVCNNRNANCYLRDVPVRRRDWDGTRTAAAGSRAFRSALIAAHSDGATGGSWTRSANRKECTLSVPTGIGRQVGPDRARDPDSGGYSGRQHLVLPGMQWREGDAEGVRRWAAASWSTWRSICRVTDLCERFLWELDEEAEHRDCFDSDGDSLRDEVVDLSLAYRWSGGSVSAVRGRFCGELKRINKVNLNEVRLPPLLPGLGWQQSYSSIGRKPLRGFHSPSDAGRWLPRPGSEAGYHLRLKPWDLDDDDSLDRTLADAGELGKVLRAAHCGSSPVYTILVAGIALDESGEVAGEVRLRATVERTWDGRIDILEFNWLPGEFSVGH